MAVAVASPAGIVGHILDKQLEAAVEEWRNICAVITDYESGKIQLRCIDMRLVYIIGTLKGQEQISEAKASLAEFIHQAREILRAQFCSDDLTRTSNCPDDLIDPRRAEVKPQRIRTGFVR
jgi:hypothetical protein